MSNVILGGNIAAIIGNDIVIVDDSLIVSFERYFMIGIPFSIFLTLSDRLQAK